MEMTIWIVLLAMLAVVLTVLREKKAWRIWNPAGILSIVNLLAVVTSTIWVLSGVISESASMIETINVASWTVAYPAIGQIAWIVVAFWMAGYTKKMSGRADK
jgi:hypothetical protein